MSKLILAALIIGAAWLLLRRPVRPRMPDAEARAILGVGDSAGADEIRAQHRKLIAAVHPDRGGSEELTRRINAARDTLLRNLR